MKNNKAIIYAEGRYQCADGKTAHGLVRHSKKFQIQCVIDSTTPEGDAGDILDGHFRNIPLVHDLKQAFSTYDAGTFIIGAVTEGGMLPPGYDTAVTLALHNGLDIVSGLHQFLSDIPNFKKIAQQHNSKIIDVRKIFRDHRRFYTGEIDNVHSIRIAILGTDSAIGKRTIAVMLDEALKKQGKTSEMIYTGQTGWMQGWPHGIILDAMINDFVSGGIEGAIIDSWNDTKPEYIIIEGQGSLVHPFFPGGYEILAAGKVHGFIVVHAPKRSNLDGFPAYPMPNPDRVIKIAELLTEKPLIAIGLNNENMNSADIQHYKKLYHQRYNVPIVEPLSEGVKNIIDKMVEMYGK